MSVSIYGGDSEMILRPNPGKPLQQACARTWLFPPFPLAVALPDLRREGACETAGVCARRLFGPLKERRAM